MLVNSVPFLNDHQGAGSRPIPTQARAPLSTNAAQAACRCQLPSTTTRLDICTLLWADMWRGVLELDHWVFLSIFEGGWLLLVCHSMLQIWRRYIYIYTYEHRGLVHFM